MRRSPEFPCPAAVLGPDGRVEPFDGARLAVSLRHALEIAAQAPRGTRAQYRAADLAAVVELFLSRDEQGPLVGRDEVADLGRRVLIETGHDVAAEIYEARRLRARLKTPHKPGADPYSLPLAELISEGVPGSAIDRRLAGALFCDHALRHVLPSDAVAAQADGWIDFRPWLTGARVVEAVLPRGWAAHQGGGRAPRSSVLGAALRPLVGLVLDHLVMPWEGPLPGQRAAQDLGHQLVNADPSAGRVVLSLSADRLGLGEALVPGLLSAMEDIPMARWALRLHGPCDDFSALARLSGSAASVEVSCVAPPTGCVSAAARIDLVRLAEVAGVGRPGVFLDVVAEAVQLAQRGLCAWADSEPVSAARQALAPHLGDGATESVRVELAGWSDARRLLLGDGIRARANGDDLAAALGERLSREGQNEGLHRLMLVASGNSPEDAAEVARLAELLRLCSGAALPASVTSSALAEDLYRSVFAGSSTPTGSSSCA
ncbi:MAG: hypothetical protein ACI9EF_002481 [Pseudohongiellaceae bacterium]